MKNHKWSYYSKNHSYSMSKGAENAYENGLKPWSKWNKKDILEELYYQMSEEEYSVAKKMKLEELKSSYLTYCEWHHVGRYAMRVNFYKVSV